MRSSFDPPGIRLFVCRCTHLVLALLAIISIAYVSFNESEILFGYAGACMAVVLLIGAIAMFAFRRPRDVHWHLILMLDWLALILTLYSSVVSTLYAAYITYNPNVAYRAMVVVSCICGWVTLGAIIFAIVRTYKLRKQGRLPPPGKHADDWVRMEEQDVTKP